MWKAYLIETMTGRVGAEIEMSTNGRHDIRLNETEQATVTCQKSSLAGIRRRWFTPWRGGILVTFTHDDGTEVPWIAGPISSPPNEHIDSLSFTIRGIREVLTRRLLLSWDPTTAGLSQANQVKEVKASRVSFKNTSYAHMAQEMVRLAMAKTGGSLPITFATTPEVDVPNGYERMYYGYDVANNDVDKLIGQLSDVINGPDIMFRPAWVDETHSQIRWEMHTGNQVSPAIPQTWTMSIDTTAPRSQVSEFSLETGPGPDASRAYAVGAGDGDEMAMAVITIPELLDDYRPLLETVTVQSSVKESQTLLSHAGGQLGAGVDLELHLTVDCNDPRSRLSRWRVGDKASVTVRGWLSIPDGTREYRIIRAQGDFDTSHITLYLQEDQW